MSFFSHWTDRDVAQHNARKTMLRSEGDQELARDAVEDESDLHADILKECRRRGWLPFHGSMAHSTFRTPGEPDFVLLCHGRRVLLVECKTKTGKLTPDQQGVKAWAESLGFEYHIVWSFPQFLTIADSSPPNEDTTSNQQSGDHL
jgi:hypothetical protein